MLKMERRRTQVQNRQTLLLGTPRFIPGVSKGYRQSETMGFGGNLQAGKRSQVWVTDAHYKEGFILVQVPALWAVWWPNQQTIDRMDWGNDTGRIVTRMFFVAIFYYLGDCSYNKLWYKNEEGRNNNEKIFHPTFRVTTHDPHEITPTNTIN